MSFSCQLTLCREAESEGFLGFVEIDVCSYEFKAESAAGVAEDVDRNANNWATFEARSATEKPPSSSKSPKADSIASAGSNFVRDATDATIEESGSLTDFATIQFL